MAMRYRTSVLVAFGLLVLYFIFWKDNAPFQGGSHAIDVLKGATDTTEQKLAEARPPENVEPVQTPTLALISTHGVSTSAAVAESTSTTLVVGDESSTIPALSESQTLPAHEETETSVAAPEATNPSAGTSQLQDQFDKEYDALGLLESAGAIYGSTLNHLVGAGSHAGFHSAALTPTESWTPYSNTPPYTYNPYPEYNDKAWKANNVGEYVPCDGPDGAIRDVLVFSGHPVVFDEPLMGSYVPLDIDSNLCFERQARLGAYGYEDEDLAKDTNSAEKPPSKVIWDTVDWRILQEQCVEKNANRFSPVKVKTEPTSTPSYIPKKSKYKKPPKPEVTVYGTGDVKRALDVERQAEVVEEGLHGMPETKAQIKSRTAVLLRSTSERNYTENDLENIRSLVAELSLRSGGEYTVYLLVNAQNGENPIWSDAREEAMQANVPKEFQGMTIVWNQAMMEEFYPKADNESTFHQSEWYPVQKFAQDYPQYDFFWNLELDYRYTGHHYNLLEKLSAFSKVQPRKGLWERNERFYIPSVHGPYDTKFRATVEQVTGWETVWGAPRVDGVKPEGPVRPAMDPRDDNYEWGVGEEADYISLAPIFNPTNTSWVGKDDIWGYIGAEATPRRATVGMNSRCSKKLLKTMDDENLRGNHIGSEMGPQTVALLHGLKAVFAPIPMFFDRAWNGNSLNELLNPGPKGESGSVIDSPFSEGSEVRFEGSTWYEKAVVPRRLYYNWMGWEYRGIGGAEWEKAHGRTCLPPILLHPINNMVKPPPDHSSKT